MTKNLTFSFSSGLVKNVPKTKDKIFFQKKLRIQVRDQDIDNQWENSIKHRIMKNAQNVFLIVCLSLISLPMIGQSEQANSNYRFSLRFGPSFPLGDFADDDPEDEDSGFAGTGISLGGEFLYPVNEKNLSLYGGLDVIYNGLQIDRKDFLEDQAGDNKDINSFSNYLNVPVSGGLHYQHNANERVSLFTKVGLVASFLKVFDSEEEQNNIKVTQEYELSNSFGFNLAGGLILNKKTILSISYFGLGEYDVDGLELGSFSDRENQEPSRKRIDLDRRVRMVTFTIGVQF